MSQLFSGKDTGGLFEHGTHIPYHRRPSPVPNATKPKRRKALSAASITNTKKEKALPATSITKPKRRKACNEYHKAKKEKIACSEGHNCQKRGGQCKKRSPPRQGKQKENDCKNRSLSNLGCDVGLEPTTPRTTIWCSTN